MDRKALETMLAQGTDNHLLRYTLGTLCVKEGLYDEAARHLRAALDFDSAHSATWKYYGKALTELGRLHDAQVAYEKGIGVAEAKGDVQVVKELHVFLKRLKRMLQESKD